MARIKRGVVSRRKHKKLQTLNKGFRGTRSRLIRAAKEARLHADAYSFQGRKKRKNEIRKLWIVRIGEAAKKEGLSYSVFINRLKKSKIDLDRKSLNDIVINDPQTFKKILDSVRS